MNREQAGHLLDAYVRMMMRDPDEATDALREVILDAMTSYRATTPGITLQGAYPLTVPNVINNKPIVTCNAGGVG